MASRRTDVTTATADAISTEEIRRVDVPSVVNMWASCGAGQLRVPVGSVNTELQFLLSVEPILG